MTDMMKRVMMVALLWMGMVMAVQGQRLNVDVMRLDPTDLSGLAMKRLDANGETAALIKVSVLAPNPVFSGNLVGKVNKQEGYFWVYLTAVNPASQDLRIATDGYHPIQVKFSDYGITSLAPGATYILELSAAQQPQPVVAERTVEQPRPAAFANGLEPRWSSSVTAKQKTVLEKLIANMVLVEGGTFMMGATAEQGSDADYHENPVHEVALSSYYIGKYEVTQAEWEAVMGTNPSEFKGDNRPIERVSWEDCQDFVRKLNSLTGLNFSLPTEAQWEYAARGGRNSRGYKYSGSNDIGPVAWYGGNSGYRTHPVGGKQANELGLHDMSGNVWEWCSDWYWKSYYSSSPQTDPTGPSDQLYRVLRGGSWNGFATFCRVAYRGSNAVSNRYNNKGMRLAL